MPHFFSNRPRTHSLFGDIADFKSHFRWETVNAAAYALGGVVFILGSVLFYPSLKEWREVGAGIFLGGSLLYLAVTAHDLLEVIANDGTSDARGPFRRKLDLSAAIAYVIGTLLFTVGSVFFFPSLDHMALGAWCFVIGSALFVYGAMVNVVEIVFADDMTTLQLLNLTAVSYVVGSVLFCVASIPYLWNLAAETDRMTLNAFLASLFVVGSALFLIGGGFNYWRAWLVAKAPGGP